MASNVGVAGLVFVLPRVLPRASDYYLQLRLGLLVVIGSQSCRMPGFGFRVDGTMTGTRRNNSGGLLTGRSPLLSIDVRAVAGMFANT